MNNIEILKNECKTIEDNARHTAEAHYLIASKSRRTAFILEVIPALIAAASGLLVVGELIPIWWGWLTVVSAAVTATSSIISPHKSYYENLNAGKSFTVVKNRAKSFHETFSNFHTDEKELIKEVKMLSEYYNQLVLLTPPTQEWAYKKAERKLSGETKIGLLKRILGF